MSSSVDRVLGQSNQYDVVFTDKTDNATMDQSDFINLMIKELQNQDFTNPVDNSEMISQMATFANLQAMQDMASYSKTLYAAGLVGKTVTASRYNVSGGLDTTTGTVQKISLVDDEYVLYIGGKTYTLDQIMQIGAGTGAGSSASTVDPKNYNLSAASKTADSVSLTWEVPTEDTAEQAGLKYSVYYSTDSSFDTVEKVTGGTLAGYSNQTGVTAQTVSGLEANTSYYFNVVVTDANGNQSVFNPVKATTTF